MLDNNKNTLQDFFSNFGCLIIILMLIIASLVGRCVHDNVIERKKQRLMHERELYVKDSILHVKDSLAHDKHYQDSLEEERKRFEQTYNMSRQLEAENTLVIINKDDSLYHYCVNCCRIKNLVIEGDLLYQKTENINSYVLETLAEATKHGYKLCEDCEENDNIIMQYEDGELISTDDAWDYVKDNVDNSIIEDYIDGYRYY